MFKAEINLGGKRSSEKMQHEKRALRTKETEEEMSQKCKGPHVIF